MCYLMQQLCVTGVAGLAPGLGALGPLPRFCLSASATLDVGMLHLLVSVELQSAQIPHIVLHSSGIHMRFEPSQCENAL